ncbi:hypothetical protein HBI56_081600 [Parastagonospora nodorum]|nr:hypothetical protein HBH54_125320 [Parastagonospora nodorum]KAH3951762.1 hypothetical protein HBH53_059320 [Parastagonospora nodorum]KAH4025010.1 hypothetical protein HBI13_076220 [Parastagonospora nodorum]KAH4032359.1 hypothetical protein HBI09_117840 [Parastagonospora nodorum]KAH4067643.1 hypothetical protein HBH50_129850 [Parastagonospora nodorum]
MARLNEDRHARLSIHDTLHYARSTPHGGEDVEAIVRQQLSSIHASRSRSPSAT